MKLARISLPLAILLSSQSGLNAMLRGGMEAESAPTKISKESTDERDLFEARIVGGTAASDGEFPFFVEWDGCGASLIHSDILLTAAHCNQITTNTVIVGAYKNSVIQFFTNTYRQIVERRVHPNFDSTSLDYDFMVLKLGSPVSQTPIKLNTNVNYPATNQVLTVIGFGVTSSGGSEPSTLMKVNVNNVDTTTCSQELGESINSKIKLCAGVQSGGKDSCQGDSGGPIMDANKVQVGIVSYGVGCGQAATPGVYSRVSGAITWINKQICDMSSNPPSSCGQTGNSGNSPTSAPASNPSRKPFSCFSERNTVEVENKGTMPIADLRVGDKVKDASGNTTTVYSFGHRKQNSTAEYVQVHANNLEMPLEISKDHLLLVNQTFLPASNLTPGDRLHLGNGKPSVTVHKIEMVNRSALFAPLTTSGTIVVSGVVASSYVTLQQGSSHLVLGGYTTPLSMQWLSHIFQTPHRLACAFSIDWCKAETYNSDGISNFVEIPFLLGKRLMQQDDIAMVAILVPALYLALVLHTFEILATLPHLQIACLVILSLAVVAKRSKRAKRKLE